MRPRPRCSRSGSTAAWVEAVATGAPARRGRVWLWPTTPAALADGLARRLRACAVDVRLGSTASAIAAADRADGARPAARRLRCASQGRRAPAALRRAHRRQRRGYARRLARAADTTCAPSGAPAAHLARIGGIDGVAGRVRAPRSHAGGGRRRRSARARAAPRAGRAELAGLDRRRARGRGGTRARGGGARGGRGRRRACSPTPSAWASATRARPRAR